MITILDGGMGVELARRGAGGTDGLWSAKALIEAPEAVLAVHWDFIAAGATMITTNSYSTIPSYLGKAGLAERFEELTALAGRIARQAADESAGAIAVAGALPPLSESYRADLVPPEEESFPIYRAMAAALAPHVDCFLCETMSSAAEAHSAVRAACEVAGGRALPVYVSWSLKEIPGSGLRSGESIRDAYNRLADFEIAGFLFNCTHPDAILAGLRELRPLTDKPLGGYANMTAEVPDGWTLDGNNNATRNVMTPQAYAETALRWREQGATILGGCCGVGPAHIGELARRVALYTNLQ